MIEVKFGEELERQHKQSFNRYIGSSTRVSSPVMNMVITVIITLLAIAAFLLIYAIY
jgi:type II secretory pathway component PulF